MKRTFVLILLFFWGFHFVLPMLYYSFNGFFSIYSNVSGVELLRKAFWMNTATILGAIVIIAMLSDKKAKIQPIYYNVNIIYYFICFYSIAYVCFVGGYQGFISGETHGTFLSYANMFLNPLVILLMILFYQKKKNNVLLMVSLYFILILVNGGRSAVITMIVSMVIILSMSANYRIYKNKIIAFILILAVLSPLTFEYATKSRGFDVDRSLLTHLILGRISLLEVSMIPLDGKDNNTADLDVFYEKYNLGRQILQSIDSMYPGDIWITDIQPNQYYRVAFLGYDEQRAKDNYMSINMTLPVFFFMYTNEVIGCILSIITLVSYYIFWLRFRKNTYIFLGLIMNLYSFLYCFDFVMWFNGLYISILTIGMFKLFSYAWPRFIKIIKSVDMTPIKVSN